MLSSTNKGDLLRIGDTHPGQETRSNVPASLGPLTKDCLSPIGNNLAIGIKSPLSLSKINSIFKKIFLLTLELEEVTCSCFWNDRAKPSAISRTRGAISSFFFQLSRTTVRLSWL